MEVPSVALLLIKQQFVSIYQKNWTRGATEVIKTSLQLEQVRTMVCKPGWICAQDEALYEEVRFQQQSCAPEACGAPGTRRCLNLLLAVFGRTPRCQRKAMADFDTACVLQCISYSLIYIHRLCFAFGDGKSLSSVQVSSQSWNNVVFNPSYYL